ncbi:MAG TPA: aminotransferase class V-fold PLP-dependent enzyme [Gemmataceae bacterium]|nr:aminotransferase class V-fold PLP-dependent enzyme [Gemmataceae bacterium]
MKNADETDRVSRRGVLKTGAGLALGGVLGASDETSAAPPARTQSVYEAIGVKHVINATGTVTTLGGSLMPPEVVAAWSDAARHFVDLSELQEKVGAQIAKLIGVEAAMVTTGAAGAILLGTAAAVTGGDPQVLQRLPDTAGMRNEVLLQKAHHTCYDNQLTDVGVRLIEVETAADVDRVVNNRTALMFFLNLADADGRIPRAQWVDLARRHKVPTLLDAAADVPPVEHLAEYNRMGFDLVAFSGGKALRGPNDTGLLVGRKDLIEAAKRNTNPHCGTIGRMMKVSKEDMVAVLAAVERYLRIDHQAEWREWERRLGIIEEAVRNIPTLRSERIVPPIANQVPHVLLHWDESRVKISRAELTQALAEGEPPIQIGRVRGTGDKGILISVFMLQDGEELVVADRLRSLLRKASS